MKSVGLLALSCWIYLTTYSQSINLYKDDEFEQMKGKLPWPVDNVKEVPKPANKPIHGSASRRFLTIHSDSAFTVKACANGLVAATFDIEGSWAVLLRHGNYFTVYADLTSLLVKRGDTVLTHQPLGRVTTRLSASDPFTFDLLIHNKAKSMDPEPWLMPRIIL